MKTIKIISALSLVLIFAAASSLFAGNKNVTADKLKVITYIVKVDNSNFIESGRHYLIELTDGSGRAVAAPQTFRNGVSSYTFKEVGNKYGTRVARMVAVPFAQGSLPIVTSSKSGFFIGGSTHQFMLRPGPEPMEAGGEQN